MWRSHFLTATALTTAFLIGATLLIPLDPLPVKFVATLIFLDPAVIGMTFAGAYILLEKGANTLAALGVTPLSARVYVGAKILVFSVLGVVAGLAVAIAAYGPNFHAPALFAALTLSNVVAVQIGILMVAQSHSVNGFLRNVIVASLAFATPLLGFHGVAPPLLDLLLRVIPAYSMLASFESGLSGEIGVGFAVHCAYLAGLAVFGWRLCERQYETRLARGGL